MELVLHYAGHGDARTILRVPNRTRIVAFDAPAFLLVIRFMLVC